MTVKRPVSWALADGGESVVVSGFEKEAAEFCLNKKASVKIKKALDKISVAFRSMAMEISGTVLASGADKPMRVSFNTLDASGESESVLVSLPDPTIPTGRLALSLSDVQAAKDATLWSAIETVEVPGSPARLVIEGDLAKHMLDILLRDGRPEGLSGVHTWEDPQPAATHYRLALGAIADLLKLASSGQEDRAKTAAALLSRGLATPSIRLGR